MRSISFLIMGYWAVRIILPVLIIGFLIALPLDASAKKIALEKGDWVKSVPKFEWKGGMIGKTLADSAISYYEVPSCEFSNQNWFKIEVIDVSNENPSFKASVSCGGIEYELEDFFLGGILPFIPVDVQVGDVVKTTKEIGEEKVVAFEKINVGPKTVDVIKTYSELTIEEEDGTIIQAYSAWYEKNSGLLIQDRIVLDAGVILFEGHTRLTGTSTPIDFNIPPRKVEKIGGGCLIATATFGSELAPQVQQLRELRDNTLLQTESGSAFINEFNKFYYTFSPTIADWERQYPLFKEVVKLAITPLLTTLSLLNHIDIDSEEEMLGYGTGVILLNIGMYFVVPAFVIIKLRKQQFKSYIFQNNS